MKKIIHLYWGRNKPLSYLRSLTAKTFRKLNPKWEVYIWTPSLTSKAITWNTNENMSEYTGKDYLKELEKEGFIIHPVNTAMIGIPSEIPEVHKSDLFRWYVLSKYGGLWSDFDILYVNPISEELFDSWKDKGAGVCQYRNAGRDRKKCHAIGFLISAGEKGTNFFDGLFKFGLGRIPQTSYQAFGSELLIDYMFNTTVVHKAFYFSPELVYHYYQASTMNKYFEKADIVSNNHIGFHWYGGNPTQSCTEDLITPENIQELASKYAICREAVKVCL